MENWKPIDGFDYEVSDLGRVRRVWRNDKKVIAFKITKDGYHHVCLWRGGKPNWRLAHRLAWETHIGDIPEGMQINHKNGDKSDNALPNLEVVTASENVKHRFRVLGHAAPNNPSLGEKNGGAKLKAEQVLEIRETYARGGITQPKLAERYGVSLPLISLIIRRRVWGHI
jgi:hypothetical protein